ncbi:MAG: GYF domain-containing protein [Pirellulaceae bacterium]
MGIRFRCHHCETELHVKDFQAGKRGRCPECQGKFRIPPADAPHSLDPGASLDSAAKTPDVASGETTQAAPVADAEPNRSRDQVERSAAPQAAESVADQSPSPPTQLALPQALQSAVESKWYVRPPSGGQFGPAPSEVMWQWLGENRVGRDALVWCEGWPEWLIAENVFDDYFSSVEQDSVPPSIPDSSALGKTTSSITTADATLGPPSLSKQVPHIDGVAVSEQAVNATATPSLSLSDRQRVGRKLKRRRNYTVMIATLTVIMLLLIAALIVVLMRQPA